MGFQLSRGDLDGFSVEHRLVAFAALRLARISAFGDPVCGPTAWANKVRHGLAFLRSAQLQMNIGTYLVGGSRLRLAG
jgi:hypothetical protein